MRNYNAAYMGNHHLQIKKQMKFKKQTGYNEQYDCRARCRNKFRESMNNKAQLDFLEHKSSVNKTILEVNKQLTEINKKLIELNRMIMKKMRRHSNLIQKI